MKILRITILLFVLFFSLSGFGCALEITSFCPDTWMKGEGDEFFEITGEGSLFGISISDGEGSVRFPEGSAIKGSLVVAREGSAYRAVHGEFPDYEIYGTESNVPDMMRFGRFQMGNSGDELILKKGETVIFEVSWPYDVCKREGQVHVFSDGVWDKRPVFIGQSDFKAQTYENVNLTVFVSPDCSYDVLSSAFRDASEYILINVYEFSNPKIAGIVGSKAKSGVKVSMLLEGGPVGGIPSSEYYVASVLNESGVPVYSMETENGIHHSPYRYDHAKYVVFDGESVLLASENFGVTGFPKRGSAGNRGFGVYIRDEGVAGYFESVFETDVSSPFVSEFKQKIGTPDKSSLPDYDPVFEAQTFEGASVTPVISPDTSCLIRELIESARVSVDIEQAYIKNWSSGDNPYLEAAISAAERGVRVRVLLDSYWYNVNGENDNDEMADYINSRAEAENLPLEARTVSLSKTGFEKIHNKGVIVDGSRVLVSSVNWNENSPQFNREAGVIIEHQGVGEYFGRVFDYDWEGGEGVNPWISDVFLEDGDYGLKNLLAVFVIAIFIGLYVKRRR
ncbi:phospholipase [Methanoplanus sp. FWC-SCC4]|uniref:Phospholipase n=1 Tax=Methanochimaera problematica TaxID=2609417 RepID=A0AA97FDT9_9EURY|nr:phospholipase D-like domain-containing protein [Methanoplanus sp. FWC-SCC4]WOF17022.1 phospholipase [Methanoplanus sp. FWC-SCC4]